MNETNSVMSVSGVTLEVFYLCLKLISANCDLRDLAMVQNKQAGWEQVECGASALKKCITTVVRT
jgi:hypothetical protein